jgi:protein-disulfide isomerase
MEETTQKFAVPIAIVIAGALIAGAVYFASFGRGPAAGIATQGPAQQPSVNIKDVKVTADDIVVGNANAPVTLAYWADYQCPFCKQFEVNVLPDLLTKYVNTGKVRIVFKDFPFLGDDSITAALYAHAIWELYPAKLLAWNEAMFNAQDAEGDQGFGDEDSIVKLTGTIPGIDAMRVKAKVAEKKDAYMKIITDNRDGGAKLGVNGTPGFILGNTLISGAQPLSSFSAVIDPLLK